MKYRPIDTGIYRDVYFSSLNHAERNVFIYLFSNDRVNKCGLYELPDKFILTDNDITEFQLTEIKKKFEADRKYLFYKGWIYILNFATHNRFSTAENILLSFKKEFDAIPISIKQYFFKQQDYVIPIVPNPAHPVIVKRYMLSLSLSRVGPRVGGRVGPRVGGRVGQARNKEDDHKEDIEPSDIPW